MWLYCWDYRMSVDSLGLIVLQNGHQNRGAANMEIDRVNLNRALAKAIAYKQCGKDAEAEHWAKQVVRELGAANILKDRV